MAEGIVRDIVLWEQCACSSPRFVLVRADGMQAGAHAVASSMADAFDQAGRRWPIPRTDVGRSVLVAAQRQQYALQLGLREQGKVLSSAEPDGWTVVYSKTLPDQGAINSATGRFVFVCPVDSGLEVIAYLQSFSRPVRRLLQKMAYYGNDSAFLDEVTRLGVARISRMER